MQSLAWRGTLSQAPSKPSLLQRTHPSPTLPPRPTHFHHPCGRVVEDKTFGMKNKKGSKGQKFVQSVQKSKEAGEKQRAAMGKTPEQLELEKLRKCVREGGVFQRLHFLRTLSLWVWVWHFTAPAHWLATLVWTRQLHTKKAH